MESGVVTQRGWLQDSTTNLVTQWSISKMAMQKKVGSSNEYELNNISAGNIYIYMYLFIYIYIYIYISYIC